MFKYATITKML